MEKPRRTGRNRLVWGLALILPLAVLAGVITVLFLSDRLGDHRIERQAELWAHERLIRAAEGVEQSPFVSDGCSGGMSALWRELSVRFPAAAEGWGERPPWEGCCIAHDRAYHNAGGARTAEESFYSRLGADRALRACVSEYELQRGTRDAAALAEAMYVAVRAGGGPCTGLPWRWGYGYPACHLGNALIDAEIPALRR